MKSDARLHELRAQYEIMHSRAWGEIHAEDLDSEQMESRLEPLDKIKDEMSGIRARTLAGLMAKAHVACLVFDGHYETHDPDQRLARSILDDLLAAPAEFSPQSMTKAA